MAWEWKTGEQPFPQFGTTPGAFENTPIMIDNVLYLSTPYNRVVALDAETGRELWSYDPKAYEEGAPASGQGFVHRGVAAWRDGDKLRIFMNSRYHLICLDAKTGQPVESFGNRGSVDVGENLVWPIQKKHYSNTSPPVVYKDLVILGSGIGDRLMYRNDPPGDVRAFSAKTGKMAWSFHTIPQKGEFGSETWGRESWALHRAHQRLGADDARRRSAACSTCRSARRATTTTAAAASARTCSAEALVCLDAATGKRKWHFQIVHHGLWDYDPAVAAEPRDAARAREEGRRRRPADEAGLCLRVRPRHRRPGLADRGAARAPERRARRGDVADAAVSDQAAGLQSRRASRSTMRSI